MSRVSFPTLDLLTQQSLIKVVSSFPFEAPKLGACWSPVPEASLLNYRRVLGATIFSVEADHG